MELRNVDSCLNCENLVRDFICSKHNLEVEINNLCESHTYKESIAKDSSCANCSHFGRNSCSKPLEANNTMVCFDWEKM